MSSSSYRPGGPRKPRPPHDTQSGSRSHGGSDDRSPPRGENHETRRFNQQGLAPRVAAATLLWRVLDQGMFLGAAEAKERDRLDELSPSDRKLAHRLTRETLRRLGQIDAMIDERLSEPLPDDSQAVRHALRLATVETRFLGAKPHAAVDNAVTLARRASPRMSGLANAVCRRIAEGAEADDGMAGKADTPESALRYNTPDWLRDRLVADWGKETASEIALAHLREAPLDLTPRTPGEEAAQALATAVDGHALPTGSVRVVGGGAVVDMPGYRDGTWWVQDAAAAIPARLLGAKRRMQVVDLCAAPGGKTLQLSSTGAQVTAVDISAKRLESIDANIRRARLNATLVAADVLTWRPEAPVDAVLLDAPCSASGTIRRHPELPYVKDGDGIAELAAIQDKLLDAAWEMLKPGGTLVFCTCSLFREEGEDRRDAALSRLEGVELVPVTAEEVGEESFVQDGSLRILPHYWSRWGGLDGFFAFRLRKEG